MVNRKRNIQMKFWVTEEEKRLIDEKMSQLPTKRYGAYLRKMAIDGYIIQVDTTDIREMTKALGSIGRNINQIAKRVNAGGPAYYHFKGYNLILLIFALNLCKSLLLNRFPCAG